MADAPTVKFGAHAVPPKTTPIGERGKKLWGKTKPIRYTLGLAFVLHGYVQTVVDFSHGSWFLLHDLEQWWSWLQARWADLQGTEVPSVRIGS